jgi:hypothetical protein
MNSSFKLPLCIIHTINSRNTNIIFTIDIFYKGIRIIVVFKIL